MVKKLTVFISSVMDKDKEDIEAERKAVINAVKKFGATSPWAFEHHPASPLNSKEYYLQKVKECEIFCLVVGRVVAPAVREEYEQAEAENKRIFAFFKDCDERPEEVEQLRNIIRDKGHLTNDFSTVNQLSKYVEASLQEYINYLVDAANKQSRQLPGFVTTYAPPNITPRTPPEVYISRPKEMGELRSSVLRKGGKVTGIFGMGGIGKSVLVSALWRDPEIREAFPDGIITISIDKETSNLRRQLRKIGQLIGDNERYYDNDDGISRLKAILATRSALLVLDNVMLLDTVNTFKFDTPHCHLIVTTRNRNAIPPGVKIVEMQLLSPDESVKMLESVSGKTSLDFSEIAGRVGYHPLALQIAAKVISGTMSPSDWLQRYLGKVSELQIGDDNTNPDVSVRKCVEISTGQLKEEKRPLYHSLGIFPENHWIPQELVLGLWQKLKPETDEDYFKDLLAELYNLSLIELDKSNEHITVHDLLHDYNKHALGKNSLSCHNHLLNHFNLEGKPWYIPDFPVEHKNYLYHYLPYHFAGADRTEELWDVLEYVTKSMEKRCHKPNPKLEDLLVRIWKLLWERDKDKARSYLVKKWLPRRIPRKRRTGYSARTIAVRCAYEVRYSNGLATALCHSDERVHTAALRYIYSLSHQLSGQDTEEGVTQALDVLEILARRASWFSLAPNVRVLKSAIPALIVVATGQDQRAESETHVYARVSAIVRKITVSITKSAALRVMGSRARIIITRLYVNFIEKIFTNAQKATPNNITGLKEFFSQPEETRNLTIKSLRYLDRTYGSADDLKELVPKLLFSSSKMPIDRITALVNEYIIIAHGLVNPVKVESVIQEIAAHDDVSCLSVFGATHLWYVLVDRQPEATVSDGMLKTMRDFVTQWLEASKPNYGVVKYMGQSYHLYPLAYYAALWTKAKKGVEVDLFNKYAKQAEETQDEDLKLHIAGSFGDFRQILHDYPTALKVLTPYIETAKPGTKMWYRLIESLGPLYSLQKNPVLELLEETKAPEELMMAVETHSYQRPANELYMRTYQIIIDIIANSPVELVRDIIQVLESGLKGKDIGTFFAIVVDGLIKIILDSGKLETQTYPKRGKA